MITTILLIALILLLIYLYWKKSQTQPAPLQAELTKCQTQLNTFTSAQTRWQQQKAELEAKIYQTDRDIIQARKLFHQLRLLVNEWNVFKGIKEIKELVEQMRNNPVLEEVINHD